MDNKNKGWYNDRNERIRFDKNTGNSELLCGKPDCEYINSQIYNV